MGDVRQRGKINLLDQRAPTPASQIYFPHYLPFFEVGKERVESFANLVELW